MWLMWSALGGCVPEVTETMTEPPTDTKSDTSPTGPTADTSSTSTKPCGPGAEVDVDEGYCAPDFTLPDRDGNLYTFYDYRGSVTLVDIVGLWCHSCGDLAPLLQAMQEAYGKDGFQVFTMMAHGTSPRDVGTMEDAGRWVDQFGVTYPVVADVDGKAQWEWSRAPDIVTIPMTYIMDQDGIVRWFGGGDHHAPAMEASVASLLGVKNLEVTVESTK